MVRAPTAVKVVLLSADPFDAAFISETARGTFLLRLAAGGGRSRGGGPLLPDEQRDDRRK